MWWFGCILGERCKRYWETFEKMMRCIYTRSVEVDLRIAHDLLRAADQYLLDGVIDFQDVSLQPLSTNKIPCDGAKPDAISAPDNLLALASKQGTQERDHSSERIGMFTRKVWNCRRVNLRVHSIVKKAHLGLVTALAFSQDSRDLVFASLDSSARVTQIKETKNNGISLFLSSLTSSYKHHVAAEGTTLVKQVEDAASNKKAKKRLQVDPATWPIMIFRVC
uniref:Uncharacterized protein n=1 Tax=Lactuca sativa TaxID=4236 RepID=A0A9R1V662_LACSA|nr:hypothetical protein LSAT_V11C600302550 [Lactuca sativa]